MKFSDELRGSRSESEPRCASVPLFSLSVFDLLRLADDAVSQMRCIDVKAHPPSHFQYLVASIFAEPTSLELKLFFRLPEDMGIS